MKIHFRIFFQTNSIIKVTHWIITISASSSTMLKPRQRIKIWVRKSCVVQQDTDSLKRPRVINLFTRKTKKVSKSTTWPNSLCVVPPVCWQSTVHWWIAGLPVCPHSASSPVRNSLHYSLRSFRFRELSEVLADSSGMTILRGCCWRVSVWAIVGSFIAKLNVPL